MPAADRPLVFDNESKPTALSNCLGVAGVAPPPSTSSKSMNWYINKYMFQRKNRSKGWRSSGILRESRAFLRVNTLLSSRSLR